MTLLSRWEPFREFSTLKCGLLAVTLLALELAAVGQLSFTQADYSTDYNTYPVATGDFNGDGKIDLAVGNNGAVSILLGNGDGTFKPETTFSLYPCSNAIVLTVGDFNNDGKLDLAVDGFGGCVLLGNGDGTFGVAMSYAGTTAIGLTAGDFNNDGFLDIVRSVCSPTCGSLTATVQLGNGDGTFQSPQDLAGDYHQAVISADFNGDRNLDLAFADSSGPCPPGIGTVSILLGNGDGTFQVPKTYPIGGGGGTSLVAYKSATNPQILDHCRGKLLPRYGVRSDREGRWHLRSSH